MKTQQAYIRAAVQISCQAPLSQQWMQAPCPAPPDGIWATQEADYKKHFTPIQGRRYSAVLKRAIVCAREALALAGKEVDGVVTGTGLGCITDTERFMHQIYDNGETTLKPTNFILSTHNTIGSTIAIDRGLRGYNCTYTQKGLSAESALLDALLQIRCGDARALLAGAFEEVTPAYHSLLRQVGYVGCPGQVAASETAVAMVVDSDPDGALCRIDDVWIGTTPDDDALRQALQEDGTVVVTGIDGAEANDRPYLEWLDRLGVDPADTAAYRHIFGENYGVSALGVYAMAHSLARGSVPACLMTDRRERPLRRAIVLGHSDGEQFSVTTLSISEKY